MSPLTTADFAAFFGEVWGGAEPFAWQQELLERIVAERRWPDLVDLPTGLGKTATVDIALFSLAIETTTESDRSLWHLPHRIVMVVDRRVIVDQAYDRASALREAILGASADSIAGHVHKALLRRAGLAESADKAGATPPLLTSVLRGGIVRDEAWARRPEIPAVIASTVDQVGSRLLFRGYGLSTGARPIHAGLLANDTLYLLDEVHLARPFAETLDAVDHLSRRGAPRAVPRRFGIVQLSATPGTEVTERFPSAPLCRPSVAPHTVESESPVAITARRTGNSKPAELIEVNVPTDAGKANEAMAKAAATAILARRSDATRLAVIVNRVDAARRIARRLATEAAKDGGFDVVLLTGRMRPADRDDLLTTGQIGRAALGPDFGSAVDEDHAAALGLSSRLKPGPRNAEDRPVIVVATQSIEAGADFDFDVLVTECASLDALRQRFGRVDRDGQRWVTGRVVESAVLCRSVDVSGKSVDPVYGSAIHATWRWLQRQQTVDFGYRAMDDPDRDDLATLLPPVDHAPLLSSSHLERWCQTSERDISAEPDVVQWLHGIEATSDVADVHVIWREGFDPALFGWGPESVEDRDDNEVGELRRLVTEAIELVPPMAAESLAVPIGEVRRWLRGDGGDPTLSDAPAAIDGDLGRHDETRLERQVCRWTGDGIEVIAPAAIRPGDTIIVPALAGGIENGNWDPAAQTPVRDLSVELSRQLRSTAVVWLTRQRCGDSDVPWPDPLELEPLSPADRRSQLIDLVTDYRGRLGLGDVPLRAPRSLLVPTGTDSDGEVHRDYLVIASIAVARRTDDLATDSTDDALSLIGQSVQLDDHLAGVGFHAERFAKALGWDDAFVAAVRLAGEVHDAGKADSRFQLLLSGGNPSPELLAKSASSTGDRTTRREIKRLAGYPQGMRHELLSLALVDGLGGVDDIDLDLVRHLVATHHGWGRYRFRPVHDPHPETVNLDVSTRDAGTLSLSSTTDHGLQQLGSGHGERFWELTQRYGWWTLAYLEAILRLADHHRSHLEQLGQFGSRNGGEGQS